MDILTLKIVLDEIDEKFEDVTDYETRCNIASFVETKSIAFLLYCAENYTYHLNFGFRDEEGKSWTSDELYTDFILMN